MCNRPINRPGNQPLVAGIAAGMLALLVAAAPLEAQQEPVRIPRSVLQRYTGEYDQDGTIIKIYLSGDTLFREVTGQRIVLQPLSETLFRMGPVFTAEFEIDQHGGVTQVLSGSAVQFRVPRKGFRAAPPPPLAAAVPVPRSVLARYVGTYEYLPGQMSRQDLRVVVRLKGDTLTRSMGQEDVVLTPLSETLFRVGTTTLVTAFVIDEAGVTQVIGTGFQQLLARLQPRP
ncbi:MAG: hypothetical protein V4617_04530 [Gemmatimonadota bacterium]